MSDTINIEINGRSYPAAKGEMIIEVADRNAVQIPRFCFHKKLTVAANCRMCLVEVERAPKPLPACATPVMDGMKIFTHSELARTAQKSVMEFLLINHPLDCPICDQGGECELQDIAMGYGRDVSRFVERKRVVRDKDLGPLIATDMTRCIHCTRCVRFGEEIGGLPEMGGVGRGEHLEIGTFVKTSVDSELSGNMIDLCPVGALTNKPFRFRARTWEMQQRDSISPHDSVGANLHLHVRQNHVMRAVPRENEAVNEVWLADRDRFSCTGLYSADRLQAPLIKRQGAWQECDWEMALSQLATTLGETVEKSGAGEVAALVSPGSTLEEFYLAQKLIRGLGGNNIDHRLREQDFSDQEHFPDAPGLGFELAELQAMDTVLLVGSNTRKEHPLVNHRLRKAALAGAQVMVLDPVAQHFNFPLALQAVVHPGELVNALAAIAKACNHSLKLKTRTFAAAESLAARLTGSTNGVVLLGPGVMNHPQAAALRGLARAIADHCGMRLGLLSGAGNGAGAWLAGAVPHRRSVNGPAGLDALAMLASPRKAYLLMGIEPELDCADSGGALSTLGQADFVAVLSAFDSPRLREYADLILPIALFPETAGTYVNLSGLWQTTSGCAPPPGQARPAWKILRVLGNLLKLDGFDYLSAAAVCEEIRQSCQSGAHRANWQIPKQLPACDPDAITRLAELPVYAVDALVRRAGPLQATRDARFAGLELHPDLAARLGLAPEDTAEVHQNGRHASFRVQLSTAIADNCVRLPAGISETIGLGAGYATVELRKAADEENA